MSTYVQGTVLVTTDPTMSAIFMPLDSQNLHFGEDGRKQQQMKLLNNIVSDMSKTK